MKTNKIKIRFQKQTDIDFGLLSNDYSDGEFKIDRSFWKTYLEARFNFEILHDELIKRVPRRIRIKYFKEDNVRIDKINREIAKKIKIK